VNVVNSKVADFVENNMRGDLQGTNGSQMWDTAIAVQALLEVCHSMSYCCTNVHCTLFLVE